jgi:hypothetical protein
LAFLQFEGALWPTRPVRFFSPLSLEKNAPACSTFSDFLVKAGFLQPKKCCRRNTSNGQTTWRSGRRERCRKAAVSGDRAGKS